MSKTNCFFYTNNECDHSQEHTKLFDLRYNEINKKWLPNAKSVLEVLLLRGDLFYQQEFNLHRTFICENHKAELLKEFHLGADKKCHVCVECFGKSSANSSGIRNINRFQAITLFEHFKMHHSFGKRICDACRKNITTFFNNDDQHLHETRFKWIEDLAMSDDELDIGSSDTDSVYFPSQNSGESDDIRDVKEQKQIVLNKFLELCGLQTKIQVTNSYIKLAKQSKKNFLSSVRILLKSIVKYLAPNDTNVVIDELLNNSRDENNVILDGKFVSVMNGITETYNNAQEWTTRRQILSIIASKISFKLIQSFLPGITLYRFSSARMYAAQYGTGALVERTPPILQRFSEEQVHHFIDFVISPHVCSDVPFGEKLIHLTDGTEVFIPEVIRNMIPSRIIQQYFQYSDEHFPGFQTLGPSSLFKILKTCKASTRKSLQGLNYFAADGSEAFDLLIKLVTQLRINENERNRLINNLKQAKQYLKSDYKVHISRSSTVADHCVIFALCDKNENEFQQTCDHAHDDLCLDCTNLSQTLEQIKQIMVDTISTKDDLERLLYKFQFYQQTIHAWKSHQLRSFNQDLCREYIIENLTNDSVYITLDWAMKWLPAKYRETQMDFYGKRGLSWHISVVLKRQNSEQDDEEEGESEVADDDSNDDDDDEKQGDRFEQKVFVHVFDQCVQDSDVVVAIIKDVLTRVKLNSSRIQAAYIRSDNAGCYHSAQTIISMVQISKETGIKIQRIDFSDPQGGKGVCDRYAAVIKSHIRRYLNEKHDVQTATQFAEACYSYGGLKGVDVLESRLINTTEKQRYKLTGITLLTNFELVNIGVRVHRGWDIGNGKLLEWNKIITQSSKIGHLNCVQLAMTDKWMLPKETTTTKMQSSEATVEEKNSDDDTRSQNQKLNRIALYDCVEEGCTKTFFKYGSFVKHLAADKHYRQAEKSNLTDTAIKTYRSKLESVENRKMVSIMLEEVTFNENQHCYKQILEHGWALPKPRKVTRYTDKQRKYLVDKFDDGINGTPWKPAAVAVDMEQQTTKDGKFMFAIEELLLTTQIRSFFGRLKSSKRNSQLSNQDIEDSDEEEAYKDDIALEERIEMRVLKNEVKSEENTKIKRVLSNADITITETKRFSPRTQRKNK